MATGEQGKLDRKAKAQGVLGVVGNAWVQAKEKASDLMKPITPTREYDTINRPQRKLLTDLERRAL